MLYLFESYIVPLLFLVQYFATNAKHLVRREENRVLSAASKRASRCRINITVLDMGQIAKK